MADNEYTKKLENVIKQMLQPLKDIPFNLVIEAMTGKKVISFDFTKSAHQNVLNLLKKSALSAGKEINKTGILRTRPNEVGNDIKPFIRDALNRIKDVKAEIPEFEEKDEIVYPIIRKLLEKSEIDRKVINSMEILSSYESKPKLSSNDSKKIKNILGSQMELKFNNIRKVYNFLKPKHMEELSAIISNLKKGFTSHKSTGYPDIIFWYGENPYYLECKTYNIKNINTTQRSFYFSPSEEFKVTYDAPHFMLSFEIYVAGEQAHRHIYKCKHYKILSIESLLLDVKYEFNADNKRLYSGESGTVILAEGEV